MQLEIYESLASTQKAALSQLNEGKFGPAWVMARRQTQGQGRMGRVWCDGNGNLMATRYQIMPITLEKISQLSFVTALAVYDALIELDGLSDGLAIKWPNDILFSGRKLCGILINSESQGTGSVGVANGIGVNIASCPDLKDYETTCLASLVPIPPMPEDLLKSIDAALEARLASWFQFGFKVIADDWLSHAFGRNSIITIGTANGKISGQVIGLHDNGALRFKDVDGCLHDISSLE